MDDKSLEILEFPQIKQILAGFTSFSTSHQLALDLQPGSDLEQVSLLVRQSKEVRQLLTIEPNFSIGGTHDVRAAVKMASLGKVLEPQELLDIQQTLQSVSLVRNRLQKLSTELPLLWDIASPLVAFDSVARDIGSTLTPNGQILDSASDRLTAIRRQLVETRQRLTERLDAMMKTPRGRKIIQEPVITEREGRYVIPIKIEYRKEIKGIVHDVSNTGVTLFIEPWVTIDMGNNIRELVTEEKREVERILRSLSTRIGANEAEISRDIELMAELDVLLAKARYARKMKAVEPMLVDFNDDREHTAVLKLIDARHPLLGDSAVPLSVEIGKDFLVLVITGPNTGGKTVALKTVGLLSLMTQCGIPIPASGDSRIPVFDNIFADIGDEQSIQQTLSSFSWHMGNVVRIIKQSSRKSLVLLDELGTSTDPLEGSALAIAILRHFLSRGTMTVATTHFSEVKALAHATPGMQNASFDFDPVTLVPTYHLTVGIPGGSNAMAVAARLGVPHEVITEAERLMPEGVRQLENLLVSLRTKEQELTALQRQLEKERREAAQHDKELAAEREKLAGEMRRTLQQARNEVADEVATLRREIHDAAAELRKEKSRDRLEQARKTMAAVEAQLKAGALQVKEKEVPARAEIAAGDTIWLKEVGVRGTVLSISAERQEVEVQAGKTRLRLGLDKVEKADASAAPAITTRRPAVRIVASTEPVARELDLRGKRADEVEPALDRYLNNASLAGLREARIIHGFGTGVVRQIIREAVAIHPLVKTFRPGGKGEGGDGVTIVEL